jgi:glycosyltransferase involved in cell wall biosynthesis
MSVRTRILIVGADDAPGGVSNYVNVLASTCDPSRFEFHCTVTRPGAAISRYLHARIETHFLPASYTPITLGKRAMQLRRIIHNNRIRLLHLHTARAGLLGCVAAMGLRIPAVYTGHSWRFEQKETVLSRKIFRLYEKFICRSATAVTFLSQRDESIGLEQQLVCKERSFVIMTRIPEPDDEISNVPPVTVSKMSLGIPEDSFVIGNTGYLIERKDPLTFVRAAKLVKDAIPNAFFLWVGDGELRSSMESEVRRHGLEPHFLITGFQVPQIVPCFLRLMDLLLFPSRIEGVPLSVIEAQLAGIPVVSAAYVGSEQVVEPGKSGYTFKPGDDVMAARVVIGAWANPDERRAVAAQALRIAKRDRVNPRVMAAEYERVYELSTGRLALGS